ncbi:hypothetical protein LOTGIDRAFT_155263 [Lottia gigantea]|uniref:Apple domain-containing protein n=1 Tax=Lottia gigantea TaxID=225164 RepID=V3ZNC3_LOTGI|nr:hypothetical protein LOTGIDRAFT_155263 [Lottia gigantea]ESO83955.1 hypothetical protein LOTGIDRAFT_155263 [Lottia gigantea]
MKTDKMIVSLWIIVLSMYSVSSEETMCAASDKLPSTVRRGKRLNGFLIEAIEHISIMVCGRECWYEQNCFSFNFNVLTGRCELNRYSGDSKTLQSTNSDSDLFSDIIDWSELPQNDPCYYETCDDYDKCIKGTCHKHDCGPFHYSNYNYLYQNGTVIGSVAVASYSGECMVNRCMERGFWERRHQELNCDHPDIANIEAVKNFKSNEG